MKEARNKSIPPKEHHIVIVQLSQKKYISIIGLQLAHFQEQGDSVVLVGNTNHPMQSILKGGGGPILLDSNAQNPKAWVSYLSCWHLIALLIRFRVARNGFYSTRGVENLIRGNNSLRGIERYARRIRGLAFAMYLRAAGGELVGRGYQSWIA